MSTTNPTTTHPTTIAAADERTTSRVPASTAPLAAPSLEGGGVVSEAQTIANLHASEAQPVANLRASEAQPVANLRASEAQTIATLRSGDAVDAVFACVRKERLVARSGTPYLTVELRDQSGSVTARAFRDADLLGGRFERGDLVRVRARVELFRGELQLSLEQIARIDDISDEDAVRFLPVSRRDLDELEGFLEHLAREVYDPGLAALLRNLLGDRELRAELRRAPCSLPTSGPARGFVHHAFLGGLLEHTVAVAQMAVELCTVHPRLDRDLLLCAALVHDLGKTREYAYGSEITRTDEGRMLGHVELGLRLIAARVPATLAPPRRMALEHCVLTHHGGDGASAQRFASAEALALQRLNALDAGVKGAFEQGLGR